MLELALVASLVIAGLALVTFMVLSYGLIFRSSLLDPSEEESWVEPVFNALLIVAALAFFSLFNLRLVSSPVALEMNVTGAIVPIVVSSYLMVNVRAGWRNYLVAGLAVAGLAAALTEMTSQGVHIPITSWLLVVGACAALSYALTRGRLREALAVAYVSASMGMLFGGDVVQFARMEAYIGPFVIGVGGILDFVFLTGVVSVAAILVGDQVLRLASSRALRQGA